jgi:hypothetical protein
MREDGERVGPHPDGIIMAYMRGVQGSTARITGAVAFSSTVNSDDVPRYEAVRTRARRCC